MKAFAIQNYGQALSQIEISSPGVGPGEILVKVAAASVNPLDERIRRGELKKMLRYPMPLILGNDMAGTVIEVGSGVSAFKPGDKVYAKVSTSRLGTFAEQAVVLENDCAIVPSNITMSEAASLPLVALTAWQALVEKGNVSKGRKVLIHGGAGGVGTIAIQLAKYLGATVATTASTKNHEFLRSIGADIVIDYNSEDYTEKLNGFDFVLSSLSPQETVRSLKVLRTGGKLVSISGPADPEFARGIGAGWLVRQIIALLSRKVRNEASRLGVEYSFLFMKGNGKQLAELARLVELEVIKPVIAEKLPFSQTPKALELINKTKGPGKIVIELTGD